MINIKKKLFYYLAYDPKSSKHLNIRTKLKDKNSITKTIKMNEY